MFRCQDKCAELLQAICKAAKEVNPQVMILTHGGPFKDPACAEYSVANSDAVGYAAGSGGERMPTERALIEVTKSYKSMKSS